MNTTFEKSLEKAHVWLKDMMAEMPTADADLALASLRATLQVLRDRLPLAEVGDLSAQMPLLVRGLLFEGWKPEASHHKPKTEETFLAGLAGRLHPHHVDPWLAFVSTMRVLDRHISPGEMAQIKATLPHGIRAIVPEPPCERTL
jgi:uncharacterized protein (DUF2267 family)